MPKNLLPGKWETDHLKVEDSALNEVEELQQIHNSVPQTRGWTDEEGKEQTKYPIRSALEKGVLPPNGSKEFFRLQSIRKKDTGQLVGFLGVYHGFPRDEVFWINTITLGPEFQAKGYGPELITELSNIVGKLQSYRQIRTFVNLKNWPSLRLCTKIGLNRMVEIVGDKTYSENSDAHVMLAKDLAV